MKVLSVDDSATMRRIIASAASVLGVETIGVGDGLRAFEVLETQAADIALVLLDWNLPGMNGFDILQQIKADPRWKHIPVMMVTSESERVQMIKAIQAGASNYLCKPFAPEDLTKKIMQTLGQGI